MSKLLTDIVAMTKANTVDSMDALATRMDQTSVSAAPAHVCSACGGEAKLRCQACQHNETDSNTEHNATWYCSRECQVKHWASHKSFCREVMHANQLYRAANLSQSAFYQFRKEMFDIPIIRITTKGSKTRIYQGEDKGKVLFPFPDKLVKNRQDEEALLAYSACESAMGRMKQMFTLAAEGTYKSVNEVFFTVKNPQREMYLYAPDGLQKPILQHWVLRVVLKGGKEYVVDFAGAQFGFHESIIPWDKFFSRRLQTVIETKPWGSVKAGCDSWMSVKDATIMAVLWNARVVGEEMDRLLDSWLKSQRMKFAAIVKLGDPDYSTKSKELLKVLSDGMAKFVRDGAKTDDLVVSVETKMRGYCTTIYFTKGNGRKLEIERPDKLMV